jgi:serine/threonine-protein kinase
MPLHERGDLVGGRYQIERLLGSGGLGEVYLALDTQLSLWVALKRLRADVDLPDYVIEQTQREARLLADLRHRNIIRVIDFGVDEKGSYFAMEFVEGYTLAALLRNGKVPLETFYQVTLQCLEGLAAAHRHQILHLDVKPANLMLQGHPEPNFTVKILDFGLARLSDEISGKREDELTIGSIFYISPEQLQHQPLDPRTDLYSLGQVCYHMLAGTVTYPDPDPVVVRAGHLSVDPVPVQRYNQEVSEPLARWVHRMIARDPAQRPKDAQEAITTLMRTLMANPLHSTQDNVLDHWKKKITSHDEAIQVPKDESYWQWIRSQSGRLVKNTLDRLSGKTGEE